MSDRTPEANAADDTEPSPAAASALDEVSLGPGVPEADAIEQTQGVTDAAASSDLRIDIDVPEADALEQAQAAGDSDDDFR